MRKTKLRNLKEYHLMFSGVSMGPSQVKDVNVFEEKDDMFKSRIGGNKCTEKELEKAVFNKAVIEINEESKPVEEVKPVEESKPVEEAKPVETVKPVEEAKPVEEKVIKNGKGKGKSGE